MVIYTQTKKILTTTPEGTQSGQLGGIEQVHTNAQGRAHTLVHENGSIYTWQGDLGYTPVTPQNALAFADANPLVKFVFEKAIGFSSMRNFLTNSTRQDAHTDVRKMQRLLEQNPQMKSFFDIQVREGLRRLGGVNKWEVTDFKENNSLNDRAVDDGISTEHSKIKEFAAQWNIDGEDVAWTNEDILKWKTSGGYEYLEKRKLEFIEVYKDVIIDAADKYQIPELLLAGILFSEFGGDPVWIDDIAYSVRQHDWSGNDWADENLTITKNPDFTSFGDVSIQIRRAADSLGYDSSSLSDSERKNIIDSLKDPVEGMYIAAKHLSDLSKIDYSHKSSDQLTDNEIAQIATRYNRGMELSQDEIIENMSYGNRIVKLKK